MKRPNQRPLPQAPVPSEAKLIRLLLERHRPYRFALLAAHWRVGHAHGEDVAAVDDAGVLLLAIGHQIHIGVNALGAAADNIDLLGRVAQRTRGLGLDAFVRESIGTAGNRGTTADRNNSQAYWYEFAW